MRCDLQARGIGGTLAILASFTAITDCSSRRLGICVILPPRLAGRTIRAVTTGKSPERLVLARQISPKPIVSGATAISIQTGGQSALRLESEDLIDIEDHRNWGDPGWKVYTPTLAAAGPASIAAGTTILRQLTLSYETVVMRSPARSAGSGADPVIRIGGLTRHGLPSLGASTTGDTPDDVIRDLTSLTLGHLHIALDEKSPDHVLGTAAGEAAALGARLTVTITAPVHSAGWVSVADLLAEHARNLERVHILDSHGTATPDTVIAVRRAFRNAGITAPVGWGSATGLAGITRIPRDSAGLDFVSFGLTPQTHHRDADHIMRTVSVYPDMIRQAQRAARSRAVAICPISWSRPDDTSDDPRLRAELAAAWLLGAVAGLAGTVAMTIFTAEQIRAVAAAPVPRLLGILGRHRDERFRAITRTDHAIAALAFRNATIIGNLSPRERLVKLHFRTGQTQRILMSPYGIRRVASPG